MKFLILLLPLLAAPVFAAETPKATANPNADPAAYNFLKAAYNNRQVTPLTLEGFDATINYVEGDKKAVGKVQYRYGAKSEFSVEGLEEADTKWLRHQVLSIASHRGSGDFNASEGKYALSFGKSADTNFGKLIERNDGEGSSCRVKDGKILELTRTGGNQIFTISIADTRECDPGKYLPIQYVVTYRDKKTGELKETVLFNTTYDKFGKYWLPTGRKVFSVSEGKEPLRSRSFTLTDIKVIEKQ